MSLSFDREPGPDPTPPRPPKFGIFICYSLVIALAAITTPGSVAGDRRDESPSFEISRPIRQLDPGEIADLVRRGSDFIKRGDLASARLVLQRAAEAGDPQAALMLAGTYDPVLFQKVGIQGFARDIVEGFAPDPFFARTWYERAKELGSAEAVRRLEILGRRDRPGVPP